MGIRSRIVGPAAAGCSIVLATMAVPAPAVMAEELPVPALDRLPFAIRDGRIARVTVRTVPFEPGRSELTPPVEAALQRLAEEVATDCFLTAEAIGHARPDLAAEGDVVEAQALARARSELVKRLLGRVGLPGDAVAALADYGFTVEETGVTLWIFRLAEGEACGEEALAHGPEPPPPRPAPKPAMPLPPRLVATEPAQEPPTPAAPAGPKPALAAIEPAAPPPMGGLPLATAEIRFEPRNSHFPPGAEAALKRLVQGLAKAPGYQFELEAAVGEPTPDITDPDVARHFQRWLAERRLARLTEWLQQNAPFRDVRVRGTLADDPSGRITVRAHALPPAGVTGAPAAPISPGGADGPGGRDGDRDRG
jgi:hypothetical protein